MSHLRPRQCPEHVSNLLPTRCWIHPSSNTHPHTPEERILLKSTDKFKHGWEKHVCSICSPETAGTPKTDNTTKTQIGLQEINHTIKSNGFSIRAQKISLWSSVVSLGSSIGCEQAQALKSSLQNHELPSLWGLQFNPLAPSHKRSVATIGSLIAAAVPRAALDQGHRVPDCAPMSD